MRVAADGYALRYDDAAVATEETPAAMAEEYHRRVRIGIGNFQALVRHPEFLTRTTWATRIAYVSHKVLRWVAPHLALLAVVCSFILGVHSREWLIFAVLLCGALVAGKALYARSVAGGAMPKLLRLWAFFYALNEAFLVASWKFMRGDFRGSWRRTSR
jgi:cellulose synthase/poly-beta-1,6-N-acetylglucosamine synthase-like glycosyltransferase